MRFPRRALPSRIRRVALLALVLVAQVGVSPSAIAFRVIQSGGRTVRWDAAPRTVSGVERSLAGGLRYSVEGGSYQALRDQLTWVGGHVPTLVDFEAATRRAFDNWTVIDPATQLAAGFHFVEDLGTTAVDEPGNPNRPGGFTGLNPGAEIDVFAATPHAGASFGASVVVFVDSTADDLTLTTGATGHAGRAISGVDIRINPAFAWSLRGFEVLLTHEIGHALGLADLESAASPFRDDDYDPTSPASALATLTNPFALLVDPSDPSASALLSITSGINANPGLDTPGVTLLMETEGIFDLLFAEPRLQVDEFAGRQFLYPVAAPEPGIAIGVGVGIAALVGVAAGLGRRSAPRRSGRDTPSMSASRLAHEEPK